MDVNRRHLIGASAAGVAGALAMSPDAARAAPLTSALGRGVAEAELWLNRNFIAGAALSLAGEARLGALPQRS